MPDPSTICQSSANSPMHLAPPTIADLQNQGVCGARAFCLNRTCQRCGLIPFDALRNAAEIPFIRLARSRRFVCSACGSRDVHLMPDWPRYRANGG
jgi:hypothetical protein